MGISGAGRLGFAVFFVVVFGYVVWDAYFGYGRTFPRATLFPLAIGVPSLALALIAFAQDLRRPTGPGPSEAGDGEEAGPAHEPAVARRRTLIMMGWVVGFFLGIWLLGFSLAVPVLTFLYLKVGAREGWLSTLVLTVLAYAFFYGAFAYALHVPFPEGLLFEWLGRVPGF